MTITQLIGSDDNATGRENIAQITTKQHEQLSDIMLNRLIELATKKPGISFKVVDSNTLKLYVSHLRSNDQVIDSHNPTFPHIKAICNEIHSMLENGTQISVALEGFVGSSYLSHRINNFDTDIGEAVEITCDNKAATIGKRILQPNTDSKALSEKMIHVISGRRGVAKQAVELECTIIFGHK